MSYANLITAGTIFFAKQLLLPSIAFESQERRDEKRFHFAPTAVTPLPPPSFNLACRNLQWNMSKADTV